MDFTAFNKINYGLYILSAPDGKSGTGCIVNTFAQVTAEPICVTVAVHKDNYTTSVINKAGFFAATPLAESAPMELIGLFGFQSGRDVNKFAQLEKIANGTDENGVPFVREHTTARFACKVIDRFDIGTHILFLAQVMASETLSEAPSMTYGYYHTVKKGITPPKASSFQPVQTEKKGWRCSVCGYIYEEEILPPDFICPVCKQPRSVFEPL